MQLTHACGVNRIPLFALLTANAVSLTGDIFRLIAIPWFVLQTTGRATQTGLTSSVAAVGHRFPRRETFIACFVLTGAMLFSLALTPPLLICLLAMAGRGIGAVLTSLLWIAIPDGRLGAGYVIDGIGLIPTRAAVASTYAGVTMSMYLLPRLRQMNATSPILASSVVRRSTPPWPAGGSLVKGRD